MPLFKFPIKCCGWLLTFWKAFICGVPLLSWALWWMRGLQGCVWASTPVYSTCVGTGGRQGQPISPANVTRLSISLTFCNTVPVFASSSACPSYKFFIPYPDWLFQLCLPCLGGGWSQGTGSPFIGRVSLCPKACTSYFGH